MNQLIRTQISLKCFTSYYFWWDLMKNVDECKSWLTKYLNHVGIITSIRLIGEFHLRRKRIRRKVSSPKMMFADSIYRRSQMFSNMNIFFNWSNLWVTIIRQTISSRSQVSWFPSRIVIHSGEYQLQCLLNAMVRQVIWTPSDIEAKWHGYQMTWTPSDIDAKWHGYQMTWTPSDIEAKWHGY